jgi:hypothetical protein
MHPNFRARLLATTCRPQIKLELQNSKREENTLNCPNFEALVDYQREKFTFRVSAAPFGCRKGRHAYVAKQTMVRQTNSRVFT